MRIVFILDWFLYYTVELANALAKSHQVMLVTRDHNYEICSPGDRLSLDDFLDECLEKTILREKLRYTKRDFRSFFEVPRVYKKIQDFKPDIVHIQANSDWRIFLLAKKIGFSKTVLTIHDVLKHPGDPRGLQDFLTNRMREDIKGVIVHGEFLKRQFMATRDDSRTVVNVIPHGAFTIFTKWDDHKINEEENVILFFGRISKYKGLEVLIKTQPLITKEIKDAKIIIAGRGEDFSKYERLMADRSCFEVHNRFISHKEIYKFFRRASVVALPYTEASQSGVLAAAYAFGKPVVATNVGSIPEAIEDGKTGFIVPANNPQLLADAIVKILRDRELRNFMSRNTLNKARTTLSWDNIARLTINVYLH